MDEDFQDLRPGATTALSAVPTTGDSGDAQTPQEAETATRSRAGRQGGLGRRRERIGMMIAAASRWADVSVSLVDSAVYGAVSGKTSETATNRRVADDDAGREAGRGDRLRGVGTEVGGAHRYARS